MQDTTRTNTTAFSTWHDRPWLLFLPFLFLYSIIVILASSPGPIVDEPNYLAFADNLLHGFYSPPPPEIDLWTGPGYAIVIAPLAALKLPLLYIRLSNAFFLYFSVVIFYNLLRRYIPVTAAFKGTLLFGFYWLTFKGLPLIMTEVFTFFLLTVISVAADNFFKQHRIFSKQGWWLAFLLAWLALTKVLFGYVLLAALVFIALLAVVRRNQLYRRVAAILLISMIFTGPYLLYTWSLTGKVFYWGNSGGANLYWMSSPHDNEWGDWFNENLDPNNSVDGPIPNAREYLEANHGADMKEILQYKGVAKDDKYKQKAFENIRRYPLKFVKNCIANTGRLLFNYPFSYRQQGLGSYLNFIPNMILLVMAGFLLRPAWTIRKQIPAFMRFLLLLVVIYFAGCSMLSSLIRMFYVLFPPILLLLCFVYHRTISIRTTR